MPPSPELASAVRGDGPRVVLLHGFTQTMRSWHHVVHDLCADHEVVGVDLPGHGDSAAVHANLSETADLVAAVGDAATYIGYSMGGRVALHLALAHPHRVQRLVLIGATAGIDDADERVARRAADEALAISIDRDGVDAFLRRWLAQPLFAGLPDDPADVADRQRNGAGGLAASLRLAGTGAQTPLWNRLTSLTMPVLVVVGEHDTKFTELGHRLVAGIGSHAQLAVVEAAGHAVHLERPTHFAARYREWEIANPIANVTPKTS
jgi:2-succinyl-6-hydroxy-2,4-cyclohexadiene-1-carboxylate synthase